jgi:site-specific DNA-methyltransferase (adenine-specific)
VIGEPEDLESAHALAHSDRYQFQWWALSLLHAKPLGASNLPSPISPHRTGTGKNRNGGGEAPEGRKGLDRGIDGVINFLDEKNKSERILVQVKSGHVKAGDICDSRGVLERKGAAMGVFLTLEEPSKDMLTEAVSAGWYHSALWQKDYALIQIMTIADIFAGKGIEMPPSAYGRFKQAGKVKKDQAKQGNLM